MSEFTAVIYARVSDKKQVDGELSIPAQIEQGHERAKKIGATVMKVFSDEGKSGRSDSRKSFRNCIEYCELFNVNYLITWSSSRFARNRFDAVIYKNRLDKASVKLIYLSFEIDRESMTGRFFDGVLELFDEHKSIQTSIDTKRSMIKNARSGYWNGGRAPFGYEPFEDVNSNGKKRLRIIEEEAETVRHIFAMKISGQGTRSISAYLNGNGLTNRGSQWNKTSLSALLKNKSNLGYLVFGKKDRSTGRLRDRDEWIEVQSFEPIVSEAIFNKVQEIMNDQSLAGHQSGRSTHPFTGLLRCGVCGSSMQIETASGRSKTYSYYNCRSSQRTGGCESRRISATKLDEYLIDVIVKQVITNENISEIIDDLASVANNWSSTNKKRRSAVTKEIATVEKRNANLYSIIEDGGVKTENLNDILKRVHENNEQIKSLTRTLVDIDREPEPIFDITQNDVDEIRDAAIEIITSETNPKTLRAFFKEFITSITIRDGIAEIAYDQPNLISNGGLVHSTKIWLPEPDVARTKVLLIDLPQIFRRAA